MAPHSNVTTAMNGSAQKLLKSIREIINPRTHAYAYVVAKQGRVLFVVKTNLGISLVRVSGSMQNTMMAKGNVMLVVNAPYLVSGIVKDVKPKHIKWNFRDGE